MGFFSSLGRALTNVKRAACRGVGKVIEKVGEITGNIDIEMKGISNGNQIQQIMEKINR